MELAFRWLKSEPKDALYVPSGPLGPAKRAEIIKLAGETHTPAIYCFRIFALGGGLISAAFVNKILKGTSQSARSRRARIALGPRRPGHRVAQRSDARMQPELPFPTRVFLTPCWLTGSGRLC